MKTLKKALAILLVVAISVSAGILGTIAYFTDTEEEVNVMTVGKVDVQLIEQQRSEDGKTLVDYVQGKNLMPVVGSAQGTKDNFGMPVAENYVDKIVSVKNTGNEETYVRILVAIPSALDDVNYANENALHWNLGNRVDFTGEGLYNEDDNPTENPNPYYLDGFSTYECVEKVEINGIDHNIYVFTSQRILKAGESTGAVMAGFYIDSKVDYNDETGKYYLGDKNDEANLIDYDLSNGVAIPVYVQAAQADGFNSSEEALEAAFGEISETNHPWLNGFAVYDYSIPAAEVEDGVVTLADGEKAVLSGEITKAIKVDGEGSLYLRDVKITATTGDAVVVNSADVKLVVEGDVSVESESGSAITGEVINISGNTGAKLTAIAGDVKAAFGIGGMDTKEITIENVTIKEVSGGYDGEIGDDTKYYKDAPEGGSAIGSGYNGAVITLNNVHIKKAVGGSKSAGIGARYHTGATININNSIIDYVEGGATAAAIGGSRVSEGATEAENVTINIKNSTITAVGGAYGAGIGSGYDTHCQTNQPVTTINIDKECIINATGGKYAAGIGTGYHVAGLAGKIEVGAQIKAVSGDKWYKDAYSLAMDVGFGVVDPAREAHEANTSSFDNQGVIITVENLPYK